jgi:hypothetical protein
MSVKHATTSVGPVKVTRETVQAVSMGEKTFPNVTVR